MLLIAVAGALLLVSNPNGAAVPGASVTFFDTAQRAAPVVTDARGTAKAPADFDAVQARIQANGFEPADITVTTAVQTIALQAKLPVIVSVNVATGTLHSLHTLPVAASALDRNAIALSGARSADSLLRTLPGFDPVRSNSAFTNYGQLRASFSGAGNDRGLVFVDGIPAQDGFGGQIDWQAYPPSDLVFAELLRGAGSALYGNGAIGGVLDLHTFGPELTARGPQTAAGLAGGTDAYSQQWINARTTGNARIAASLTLQQQRASYFDLPPGYSSAADHAAVSRSGAANAQIALKLSSRDTLQFGERIASDVQDEGRPNYTFSRRFSQMHARFTGSTERGTLWGVFFVRNTFIVNTADQFPAKPGVLRYVQDVPVSESGAIAQWSVDSANSTFAGRADARRIRGATYQHGANGALQNGVFGRQNLGGVAFQETLRGARAETIIGTRIDRVVLPRAALRYTLTPNWNVRASAGTGFRQPFLNELLRSFVIGPVTYAANPSLGAERSWTASAGADWTGGPSRFSADLAHTVVYGAIMFRTIDAALQRRTNVPQTQTDGATLTFTHAFGTSSRIDVYITAQRARVTQGPAEIAGKQLQFVPASSASIAYQTLAGRVQAGINLAFLGQTYADDLNRQPLGTAIAGDARVIIPIRSGVGVVISGSNIFSARYRSSVDRWAMPALFSVGIQSTPY